MIIEQVFAVLCTPHGIVIIIKLFWPRRRRMFYIDILLHCKWYANKSQQFSVLPCYFARKCVSLCMSLF